MQLSLELLGLNGRISVALAEVVLAPLAPQVPTVARNWNRELWLLRRLREQLLEAVRKIEEVSALRNFALEKSRLIVPYRSLSRRLRHRSARLSSAWPESVSRSRSSQRFLQIQISELRGCLGADHISASRHFFVNVLGVVFEVLLGLDGGLLDESSEVLGLELFLGHRSVPHFDGDVVPLGVLETYRIHCVLSVSFCENILRFYARNMPCVAGNVLLADLVVGTCHPVHSFLALIPINVFVRLVSPLMLLGDRPVEPQLMSGAHW